MSDDPTSTVRRDTVNGVAVLTLDAPARRNALSLSLRAALLDELSAAMADPLCRVVALTGAGGHFCAGGDIAGMEGLEPVSGRKRLETAHRIIRLMVEGDKPVIAAVEGFAVGAGLSLVAAADIVVTARSARFACSFNRLGLVPDFGIAWTLPLRVGTGRARHIMLTGDVFDAESAAAWGLIQRLVEPGEALTAAVALAERIAAEAAPLSNAFAKGLLARAPAGLDAVLRAEADAQAILYASDDFREGRAAFLGKRKPAFEGR